MTTKICTECKTEKPINDFHSWYNKNGKLYTLHICKVCKNKKRKEHYHNVEKLRQVPQEIKETIVEYIPIKKQIKCIKCGEIKNSKEFYYNKSRHSYMFSCKICNKKQSTLYQKNKRLINDIDFIFQTRSAEIRRRCKDESHWDFCENLKDILKEKWDLQKGLCYYTNIPMECTNQYHTNNLVMTVDRIDPTKGYTKDNIALCCSIVNRMKQNMSISELIILCKKIIEITKF